jgi:uroporphyrinogen-III decarboxylase
MNEMTSRERLLAVLNKTLPDRIPISPRMSYWMRDYYGGSGYFELMKMKTEFSFDPIFQIDITPPNFPYTQFIDYSKFDDITVDLESERKGRMLFVNRTIRTPKGELYDRIEYAPNDPLFGLGPNPEKVVGLVKTMDDLEKMAYLLPDPKKFSNSNFKLVDKALGDNGIVEVRPHIGVDHLLVDSLGFENALMMLYDDPELFKAAIKMFHTYYKSCLVNALEQGAKIIFESWYNCSLSAGWSPAVWREYFMPCIIEDAAITHSYDAYFHFYDDGKIMPLLDDFKQMKIDLLSTLCPKEAGGDVDAVVIKEKLDKVTALKGYVSLTKILMGTVSEVEEMTRYACEVLGKGGGYILGTSDSIRNGSPIENVRAFFETGRKYGKY